MKSWGLRAGYLNPLSDKKPKTMAKKTIKLKRLPMQLEYSIKIPISTLI